MTTYTMTGGFVAEWPTLDSEDPTYVNSYTLEIFSDTPAAEFSAYYRSDDPDFPYGVNLGQSYATLRSGTGASYGWSDMDIRTFHWNDGGAKSATVLYGINTPALRGFVVPLYGDAIPVFTSDAALKSWMETRGSATIETSVRIGDFVAEVREADMFGGTSGADVFDFGAGADTARGAAGMDRFTGGDGNDRLFGGAGADRIAGDQGNDVVQGNLGADTLDGGYGNDTLVGGDGADVMDGGAGDDRILGGRGRDTLTGGTGADTLIGGKGFDALTDSSGNTVMRGQGGNDKFFLQGWDGADDFVYGGAGTDRAFIALYDIETVSLDRTTFKIFHGDGSVDTFVDVEIFDVAGFRYSVQDLYDGILATL